MIALLGLLAAPALAGIALTDVALDSEIELLERSDYGSYARYSISIVTRHGDVVISLDRDGETATLELPIEECLALWQKLLASDMETLRDASSAGALPDGSHFTVRFSVNGAERRFRAYGVDSLRDLRYRTIVREILAVGDAQLARMRESAAEEERP